MQPFKQFFNLLDERFVFPVSCLGIGLISTWNELSFINPPVVYSGASDQLFPLFNAGSIVLAAVIAIHVRMRQDCRALVSSNRNLFTSLVLLLLSTNINFIATLFELGSKQLLMASAVIGGIGLALLFVMWFEVVSHLEPVQLLLCYALASVGRVALIWLCNGMDMSRLWVCVCCMAALVVLALGLARNTVAKDAPLVAKGCRKGAFAVGPTESKCAFPVKLLLVVLTGTLSLSFILGVGGAAWGTNGNPGVLAAGIMVVCVVLVKGDFFEFKWLWQGSLVFMIAAIIVFACGGTGILWLGGFFTCVSYELCLMLAYSILGDLVYRSFYNSTFLFSAELALALTVGDVGDFVSDWIVRLAPGQSTVILVLVGGILVGLFAAASMYAFSRRSLEGSWSAIIRKPIAQDIGLMLERSRLGLRCHELAQETGLSVREEEVLLLIAQRKKPSDIAKQLFIEVSTVNTHKKHIYQKLDVHSAKQLQDRIGSVD
ncbi:helix-turn-helix transcriptional regulator [Adlercreutzia sp. ZJ138]|uniref:helix-turn-helix transcriptional regulator n=1 Tax=Adlercreutzia sp. ZJ138 TaxID=2709405 RepID=UPI0013ED9BA1|nr:helix-turn-helix transcriptional regulator [Adlercreutzia sp. ZJ138]